MLISVDMPSTSLSASADTASLRFFGTGAFYSDYDLNIDTAGAVASIMSLSTLHWTLADFEHGMSILQMGGYHKRFEQISAYERDLSTKPSIFPFGATNERAHAVARDQYPTGFASLTFHRASDRDPAQLFFSLYPTPQHRSALDRVAECVITHPHLMLRAQASFAGFRNPDATYPIATSEEFVAGLPLFSETFSVSLYTRPRPT